MSENEDKSSAVELDSAIDAKMEELASLIMQVHSRVSIPAQYRALGENLGNLQIAIGALKIEITQTKIHFGVIRRMLKALFKKMGTKEDLFETDYAGTYLLLLDEALNQVKESVKDVVQAPSSIIVPGG